MIDEGTRRVNTRKRGRKPAAALAAIAVGAVAAVVAARLIKALEAAHARRRAGGHTPDDASAAISPTHKKPHHEDGLLAVTPPMAVDAEPTSPAVRPAASKASRHRTTQSQNATSSPRAASKIQAQQGRGKLHIGRVGVTKEQLYQEARKRNIRGRSAMTKAELLQALG